MAKAPAIVTKTQTRRIDLAKTQDLPTAIADACDAMGLRGYRLAATFAHLNQLILVFQVGP